MPFSIELHFDKKSDLIIRNLWKRLKDKGITGYMHDYGGFPHIALLVFDDLEVPEAEKKLLQFVKGEGGLELTISSLGVFPSEEGVLFAAPVVTEKLTGFHKRLYELFKDNGSIWEYYKPGALVPHCTLGINIPKAKLHEALKVALEDFSPFRVGITELKLLEFNPVRVLRAFELEG